MKKKLLTILLSVFVMMTAFTTRVFAEWTGSGSGTQGDPWLIGETNHESDVTAYFDSGTLYINGTGKTNNYTVESWAWHSIKDTITSGVIGDGVTYIGRSIFRECSNLTSVSIPNSVTEFGPTLFWGCESLTSIDLPNALTKIGNGDFCNSGITSITIPATVTQINGEAFKNCSSLSSVTVLNTTPPTIDDDTFDNSDPLQIYVPADSVDIYKTATYWSAFADRIHAIPSQITIHDLLTDNFPSNTSSGWRNSSNNIVLYRSVSTELRINKDGEDSCAINQDGVVTKVSDNQYSYHYSGIDGEFNVFFNLENGVLESIIISGATGNLLDINDTYIRPVTVGDIIPSNFPVTEQTAWTNGSHKIYKINDDILLDGLMPVLSLDNGVFPVDNGNYSNSDNSITFIMNNGKFTSIVAFGYTGQYDEYNGTYAASITVADILNTYTNFPTTETSGWLYDGDSNVYRSYINGSNLILYINEIPLNTNVLKDGNNYKCTIGSATYIFAMESNILKSITLDVLFSPAAGTYVPYKYEIEPTGSIPKGYTGNLVFKTNGQYTNDSEVEVKVNGTPLTLSSQYTVEHGSIKVTLLGDYLKNLAPGTYTLSIGVPGSYDALTSQFTITVAPTPTPTPTPEPTTSFKPKAKYVAPKTGVE